MESILPAFNPIECYENAYARRLSINRLLAMAEPKPHTVVAMGSFQEPWYYRLLKESLEKSGYGVTIVNLPSTGDWTAVPDSLTRDIAAFKEALTTQIDAGNDVVLVARSQGGNAGSIAPRVSARPGGVEYSRKVIRQMRGDGTDSMRKSKPGVIYSILIASFLVEAGISILEKAGGNVPGCLENRVSAKQTR